MDQPTQNQPATKPLDMPPGESGNRPVTGDNLKPPEPMGGPSPYASQSPPPPPESSGVVSPEVPKRGFGPLVLIILLVIILIMGILIFISWKGWISLGGLEKIWGGGQTTPSPTVYTSPKLSPAPSAAVSPEITTNVNDQIRKSNLLTLKSALKKYYIDNSLYPESLTISKTSVSDGPLVKALVPSYLDVIPDDPLSPQYWYGYKSDGQTFELTCVLEDKSDPEGVMSDNYNLYKLTDSTTE